MKMVMSGQAAVLLFIGFLISAGNGNQWTTDIASAADAPRPTVHASLLAGPIFWAGCPCSVGLCGGGLNIDDLLHCGAGISM